MVLRIAGMMFVLPLACLAASGVARADESQLESAIAEHRMGTLTIQGQPGAEVRVQQQRHEFSETTPLQP